MPDRQGLVAEPFPRDNGKHDKEQENEGLRDCKWRLRLRWSHRFQSRHLHERLNDANKEI